MQIESIYRLINRYRKTVRGSANENTRIHSYSSGFNFGFTGASVSHLKGQATRFAEAVYKRPSRNLAEGFSEIEPLEALNGWKLVNIWLGANDLCSLKDVDVFRSELMDGLETLRAKTSRVFVNLILHPNYARLHEATQNYKWCSFIQGIYKMCDVIFKNDTLNHTKRQNLTDLVYAYNQVMRDAARIYQARADPNFAVAAQPSISNMDLSIMKKNNYLSKFDWYFSSFSLI
jgi:hypothetical protein